MLHWNLDAGESFLDSLERVEKDTINELLDMGLLCFSELAPHVCERVLSPEATFDLDVALDELTRSSGARPGLSKWASLQAAEKSLKEFVRRHGGMPPHIHDLMKLHDISVAHGLPSLDSMALPEGPLLPLVSCSPGVRYGQPVVSVQEAVAAYYASTVICFAVAARLRVEAGGACWLYLTSGSPARFVVRRIAELAGVEHKIDHEAVD